MPKLYGVPDLDCIPIVQYRVKRSCYDHALQRRKEARCCAAGNRGGMNHFLKLNDKGL